jgi:hypothetical protein
VNALSFTFLFLRSVESIEIISAGAPLTLLGWEVYDPLGSARKFLPSAPTFSATSTSLVSQDHVKLPVQQSSKRTRRKKSQAQGLRVSDQTSIPTMSCATIDSLPESQDRIILNELLGPSSVELHDSQSFERISVIGTAPTAVVTPSEEFLDHSIDAVFRPGPIYPESSKTESSPKLVSEIEYNALKQGDSVSKIRNGFWRVSDSFLP